LIQDIGFWAFLFSSCTIFWLLPISFRQIFLSVASFALILYYDWLSGLILATLSGLLFVSLPGLVARRLGISTLFVVIAALALPLIFFKVFSLVWEVPGGSILKYAVPLGMSYYVFRMLHLAIEVYRGNIALPGLRDYLSYIFLFTIFVAGPIQRYEEFVEGRQDRLEGALLRDGLMRIAVGLIKQTAGIDLLVALRRLFLRTSQFDSLADILSLNAGMLWVLAVSTYLISYLNLSAYSDIAIGSSRLFGLKIGENFNHPVTATSLTDFWRRWHMTLSNWCQSYVFAPVLGMTRNPYVALVASFQVMGLWHIFTLNRVAWGLYQALGLSVLSLMRRRGRGQGRIAKAPPRWRVALNWLATQAYVSLGFLFVVVEKDNNLLNSSRIVLRAMTLGLLG
jgi:alginate O-acetyltransferase complex protein AlgI